MMNLWKAEWLKLKHSKLILLAIALPMFAVIQGKFFTSATLEGVKDPVYEIYFIGSMVLFSWLVYPLLAAIVIVMIARVEHSGDGWKQLLALPVSRTSVYCVKFFISMGILLFSLVVLYIGIWIGGATFPQAGAFPAFDLFKQLVKYFVASFPMISVLFFFSYRFQHTGIPLGIGIGLSLPAIMIGQSERFWIYYPWSYPMTSALADPADLGIKATIMYGLSIGMLVTLFFVGLARFRLKDII
ncbi:ABC transporter permease [Bacillus sp. FJAT-52991]|uniref:ABC transporter permease n=1 Tax=Bacillus kandeliae TaxID=3129297 RepID=A0ABZ2N7R4_9BACI